MNNSIFTSAEIEFLMKRARSCGSAAAAGTSDRNAETFDFRRAGHLSVAQVACVSELHEEFARQLGRSLSGLLSLGCEARFTSAEQISYSEFANQVPEVFYLGMFRIQSPEGCAVLLADLAVLLPMVDLLLGGTGSAAEAIRNLTEIEHEIFKPIMQAFCKELHIAWSPVMETGLRFDKCAPAATNLLPAAERVLALKFEVQLGELRGAWTLVLPALVSSALTRKLSRQTLPAENDASGQNQRRIRDRLLESRFGLELFLPPSTVSVKELAKLKVGQIVVLKTRATDPIHLNIGGQNLFQASPVSCGSQRGAQIKRALSIVTREEKESR